MPYLPKWGVGKTSNSKVNCIKCDKALKEVKNNIFWRYDHFMFSLFWSNIISPHSSLCTSVSFNNIEQRKCMNVDITDRSILLICVYFSTLLHYLTKKHISMTSSRIIYKVREKYSFPSFWKKIPPYFLTQIHTRYYGKKYSYFKFPAQCLWKIKSEIFKYLLDSIFVFRMQIINEK